MVGYAGSDRSFSWAVSVPVASDHPAEDVAERRVGFGRRLASAWRASISATISSAEPQLLESSLGGDDQLGATVRRVGPALDVAELLELVDEPPDDLLVAAREAGQLGCPDAVLVEVGEHGPVTRMEVVVAGLGEPGEELVLQREGELSSRGPPDPGSTPAAPCGAFVVVTESR